MDPVILYPIPTTIQSIRCGDDITITLDSYEGDMDIGIYLRDDEYKLSAQETSITDDFSAEHTFGHVILKLGDITAHLQPSAEYCTSVMVSCCPLLGRLHEQSSLHPRIRVTEINSITFRVQCRCY